MIAKKHRYGATVEAIAEQYDIILADVYGALAYYHANRADFDAREEAVQPLIDAGRKQSAQLRQVIEQRLFQKKHDQD